MNFKLKYLRNPWPVAIVAWFVAFFCFTIGLVIFITHQKMDLVRGDYYDEEIRYQEQLDRMNRTVGITNQVTVAYDRARESISVNLPPGQARQHLEGRIRLYRPSDETLDQDIKLGIDPAGHQDLDAKKLRAGLWKVRVYWTVDGHDYYFGQSVVVGAKSS